MCNVYGGEIVDVLCREIALNTVAMFDDEAAKAVDFD